MSELGWDSILDGVTLALHAAFPDRRVHGGAVRQGLRPGDLNVVTAGAGQAPEAGGRYRRRVTVDVLWYPDGGQAACCAMADRLAAALETVTTPGGDAVHVGELTWAVTDGVLHMLAQYEHFVRRPREETPMETLGWGPPGGPGAGKQEG